MRHIQRVLLCLAALSAVGMLSAQDRMTRAEYIAKYKKYAIDDMETYGIPASIKMAQALLESDDGNSPLARKANNHFGIKCKKDWTGDTMSWDDDAPQECFRKYPTAEASFRDHSEFLDKSPRYQSLFNLDPTDYRDWAYGLKAAGYATSPTYAEQLIKIIEDNKLYLLDGSKAPENEVIQDGDTPVTPEETSSTKQTKAARSERPSQVIESANVDVDNYVLALYSKGGYSIFLNNGCEFVVANEGDSIASVGKALSIPASRLRHMNDLLKGQDITGGDVVYIKSKNRRSINGRLLHTVREGETLHSISQQYGIRQSSLAALNHTTADSKVFAGQQLKLR